MDKDIYDQLVDAIGRYYPIRNIMENPCYDIVKHKFETFDKNNKLSKVIDNLGSIGVVSDYSFVPFPNLKLVLKDEEESGKMKICKTFSICISLLCPFYTYYYEYEFRIKGTSGYPIVSSVIFLNDEKFELVSRNIDVGNVQKAIESGYPDHKYIDHYPLLLNTVKYGLPYGVEGSDDASYPLLAYLFDFVTCTTYYG